MKQEELQKIRDTEAVVPVSPVRFIIDDEPFELNPLPLASLLFIEKMKSRLNVNQTLLQVAPIAEWLIVTKQQTNDVRKIVSILLGKGRFDLDSFRARCDYLREHCTVEDLCSLFIIGTIAQSLWIREAESGAPADLEGFSEDELWSKPFVELNRK